MRIAVLFHAGDQQAHLSSYIVHHLSDHCRRDGHDVIYLSGTRRFIPADLILVHVNLSVVPTSYLRFASRYPIALNAGVADIRKSVISHNLVRLGDGWQGPVIAKSDLNYGGLPEELLGRNWLEQRSRTWRRIARRWPRLFRSHRLIAHWQNYQVYPSIADVPPALWRSRHLVVEKFRPEMDGGLFHLRVYQFLGRRHTCVRLVSPTAIVKAQNAIRVEPTEPHPEVLKWRRQLRIDYGKFDYVVNDGEAVLLDVNKTTGASRQMADAALPAMRRYLAAGIYAYCAGDVPRLGAP